MALVATALSAVGRAYAPKDLRNVHLDNRTRYVTNPDGVLSPAAVTRLDSMLADVWRATTAEPLVVAIDDMAPGYDEVTFANDLFDLWKPGKKDTNNGLIILIVKNPRRFPPLSKPPTPPNISAQSMPTTRLRRRRCLCSPSCCGPEP